eukprot:1258643-Rhodomonas_salina.1
MSAQKFWLGRFGSFSKVRPQRSSQALPGVPWLSDCVRVIRPHLPGCSPFSAYTGCLSRVQRLTAGFVDGICCAAASLVLP